MSARDREIERDADIEDILQVLQRMMAILMRIERLLSSGAQMGSGWIK
jgi:hypothetical protein